MGMNGDGAHAKEKVYTEMFEDHSITVVGPLLQAKTTCHHLQGGPKDSATLFTAG